MMYPSACRITRCSERFWFDDGTLVVRTSDLAFRVHFSLLQGLSFLLDQTLVPERVLVAQQNETCPCLDVQDSSEDWESFLAIVYDSSRLDHLDPYCTDLDTFLREIGGILRLCNRYVMASLRNRAIRVLERCFPTTLNDYLHMTVDAPDSLYATLEISQPLIEFAMDLHLPSLLPAFYLKLSLQDETTVMSNEHLSWEDKARALHGRSLLLRARTEHMYGCVFSFEPSQTCMNRRRCTSLIPETELLARKMVQYQQLCMPFSSIDGMLDVCENVVACGQCVELARQRNSEGMSRLWDMLPGFYGLVSWGNIDAHQQCQWHKPL